MSAGDGIPVVNAPVDEHAAMRLWEDYRAARPDRALDAEPPSVEVFGDHPALTDELLGLVLDGTKRATASTVAEFRFEGQPLPRVGSHWIACDSDGRPRAILRSTELRIGPFSSVDAAVAYDEGEDDRTLESWQGNHRADWQRTLPGIGVEWHEELEVVFERFEVAWPPEVADG
jgi:uncharacterized protein YhfF